MGLTLALMLDAALSIYGTPRMTTYDSSIPGIRRHDVHAHDADTFYTLTFVA